MYYRSLPLCLSPSRSPFFCLDFALGHSKSVSLTFLLALFPSSPFPCRPYDHAPRRPRGRRRVVIDLYVCALEERQKPYTCI